MMWRPLLPHAWRAFLLSLVLIALPLQAAFSQEGDVQNRLDRIERDLNMLQRQVYGGYAGGYPGDAPANARGGGLAVNNEIRMERLEGQMRQLTGRVEELANEIDVLRRRIGPAGGEQSALGNEPAAPPSAAAEPGGRPPEPSELTPPQALSPPGAPMPPRNGAGALMPPGRETASAASGGNLRLPSFALPSGSALKQYNYAFGLLREADYSGAAEAMQQFIRQHPHSSLAGNAQYWLGETYYARSRYAEAAAAFAAGYKNYPHGEKAPDDLLRLGMSLARANQKQNACLAFEQLDHAFPHPGAAIAQQARSEKKRFGC